MRIAIASLPRGFHLCHCLGRLFTQVLELLESSRYCSGVSYQGNIPHRGPHVIEDVQRYFTKRVVITINSNTDDIRGYLELRLDMDFELEAMSNDLRADIVRVILEKISHMCTGPFRISTLSMMYTYQRLCADSFLFRSIPTPF